FEVRQRVERALQRRPAGKCETERCENVAGLEGADERQDEAAAGPEDVEVELLAVGERPASDEAQIGTRRCAEGENAVVARAAHRGEALEGGALGIEDGGAASGQ